MSAKEHYDNHLSNIYSWFAGGFDSNKNLFKSLCLDNGITPVGNNFAIDLGAGHGIQSIALAELGYKVLAVDFSEQLLAELEARKENHPIRILHDDIRNIQSFSSEVPSLIVCCGDTLPHLESFEEISQLIQKSFDMLLPNGKIILSFRDYSIPLVGDRRFIPVKSDSDRILTCFLEYEPDRVRVTDLVHEISDGKWIQKVSSYHKVRITKELVEEYLKLAGFEIVFNQIQKGMVTVVAEKS